MFGVEEEMLDNCLARLRLAEETVAFYANSDNFCARHSPLNPGTVHILCEVSGTNLDNPLGTKAKECLTKLEQIRTE
jgi:hypothetical protein